MTAPARSTWMGALALSPEQQAALIGPGAPFEMRVEPVLGHEASVFVQRPRSLRAMFDALTAPNADAPFLVSVTDPRDAAGDTVRTFAEARAQIDGLARILVDEYGIEKGDRVAIVSANSPEYALLMWAVVSVGAVISSLNGWWVGAELRHGIELTTPKLIAGDEPRLARIPEDAVPAGVPLVRLDDLGKRAADAATDEGPPPVDVDEDDPAVILFTSGTTGRPKGATLSHRNIVNFAWANRLSGAVAAAMAAASGAPAPAPVQMASIAASPMFHISGMVAVLMSGPVMGAKLVFPPPGRWDETAHLEITQRHRLTMWSGVPTQYWRLLRHPDIGSYDLSSLRTVGSGGAPYPPELVHALRERLPWIMLSNGYGMSETVGQGTIIGGPMMVAMPDSVGPAHPGVEVEIRDADGKVVDEGEVGEIFIRTSSVFLGYWDDPEATAAALDPERWYRTGDFGRITNGFLHLESRMRDLILRGGENIYPIEIENRLVEHPDIDDAAVIGVEHPDLGQEPKAFVVVRAGATITPAEVQAWVAEGLARFKVPAEVEVVASLPYTDTGKVMKHELERQERERRAKG